LLGELIDDAWIVGASTIGSYSRVGSDLGILFDSSTSLLDYFTL